jgi:16S rRNA (adenine1518-N6/adenine1519-N6)-dimethyltransferase
MPSRSRLGQNFLHNAQAIQRILTALGDCSQRTVVEIGPGRGAITRQLITRAANLLAIELDPELAAQLRSELPAERVSVVQQNVLDFDFAAAAASAGQRLIVMGNLPYYITSPILLKLAASHAVIDSAVLMVQKEVADRVTASPGSRDYGLLSVSIQLYGPVEPLFTLPPGDFSPPPQVHSTVFRWRFHPRFQELDLDETAFLAFLRQAFALKRKTIANNLRAAGFAAECAEKALDAASIDPRSRAETLSVEQLSGLWKELASRVASTRP